jgi:tRNA modification GTPase
MLLNRLINKEKAIVTDIPGTTRDVVDEYVNLRGLPVKIMDTAGIRASEDVVESIGINRSLETMEKADLILFVVDGSKLIDGQDASIEKKADADKTLVVFNKCDLGINEAAEAHFSGRAHMAISAKTGENIRLLEDKIFETAAASPDDFAAAALVTNARHDALIVEACGSIDKAVGTLVSGMPVDLAEIDIKDCLAALGMITGEVTDEDIIDKIFASFCLGK